MQEKIVQRAHFIFPCKMINLFQDVVAKISQKMCVLWVDVSPRVMRTKFQNLPQVFWLTGYSRSSKTTDFWDSK